ncbi:MAG: hypothetical protein MZV63_35940 [Marinilabiliales bacterium]|nr:hypothetical protein [Marinilabiliales bacterium]
MTNSAITHRKMTLMPSTPESRLTEYQLHQSGFTGQKVTIAVLDAGF